MRIEAVKLSPKKGGNGYVSSYSFNIGSKEAADCGLVGRRTIKIIDETNGSITFKAKHFTVTQGIVAEVIKLKEAERAENDLISSNYAKNERDFSGNYAEVWTYEDMMRLYYDEHEGRVTRPKRDALEKYLLQLPIETLADLVLLMYIGRDYYIDMDRDPGEERFLENYDRYNYIVLGNGPDILSSILMEKSPLIKYLETGLKLLYAPRGSDIDEILYGKNNNEYNAYDDYVIE